MAGEAREELVEILRRQKLVVGGVYSPQAQIVDAILANPDVVLRALGAEQDRKADTRIGTIETWSVTFEKLHDGTIRPKDEI